MKDLKNHIDPELALSPASVTASTDGIIIDRAGAESLTFVVSVGAVAASDGSNYHTLSLEHGDAANLSDAAAVDADDLLGTFPVLNDTNLADAVHASVGYRGTKRYVRLVVTETGTASAIIGAVAIRGHLWVSPA